MEFSIFYIGLLKATLFASLCSTDATAFSLNRLMRLRYENEILWKEFKEFYNKVYSEEEERFRRSIWDRMLDHIFNHNVKYHSGKKAYHIGLNEFSDMEQHEFHPKTTGLKNEISCDTSTSMTYRPPPRAVIPDKIDWKERGYVTEVLNQGKCGACWAFCSIASLEGQHKRITGQLVKFSEQHLIDCSKETGNDGCEGGQMCRAFEYLTKVGYVATAKSYPFKRKVRHVKTGKCRLSESDFGTIVGGYFEIPYGDEDALLKAVALIGPVAAGVDGSSPNFRHYRDGIYDDENCNNTTMNHAVTIVGYGTEKGKDYWLVKNSWGKSWGRGGFGKLVRNKNNQCGLATRAIFPVLYKDADGLPVLNGTKAFLTNSDSSSSSDFN